MDLQCELAKALVERNIDAFKAALESGAYQDAPDRKNISIYEASLATPGCANFIELCLQYGSNVHHVNKKLKKAAINYAADSRDSENINVLLKYLLVDVDHTYNDLTPLNSLAKNVNRTNAIQITECMRILLEYGASPNITDDNEMAPLHYILLNQKLETAQKMQLIELYLQQPKLSIGSELRKEFETRMPDLKLPAQGDAYSIVTQEQLLNELVNDNADRFQELLLKYQGNKSYDYIAKCIEYGSNRVLQSLLLTDIVIQKNYVEIALHYGNWQALKMLLKIPQLKLKTDVQLFGTVIANLDESPANEFSNFMKCFELLLETKVDVNETDISGRTPLHYAILYNNNNAIRMLLEHGAYLGVKSKFREIPIENIEPGMLEQYFNACITAEGSRAHEDFKIVMNYRNLKRPNVDQSVYNEMDSIVAIGESQRHRHLLSHPLISTFITLKRQNICRWHYLYAIITAVCNVSLALCITFAADIDVNYKLYREILAWILIGCFIASELIKLYVSRVFLTTNRLMNFAHILMLILSNIYSNPTVYECRVIAAFTIVTIGVQLTTLIRWVPRLSLSLYVLMLRKVTLTYLECCIPFSILFISFGLGFYILNIHNLSKKSVFEAILKTTTMATGEFDAGNIDFHGNIFSNLFLVLFVFFVTIILLNLLSGLAFGDTQTIRAEAEVNSLMCFVEVLSGFEMNVNKSWGRLSPLQRLLHLKGKDVVIPSKVSTFPNKTFFKKKTALTNVSTIPLLKHDQKDETIISLDKSLINRALEIIDRKSKP